MKVFYGLVDSKKGKSFLVSLMLLPFLLIVSIGASTQPFSPSSAVNSSDDLFALLTGSPEKIYSSSYINATEGIALTELSIMIFEENSPHKKLMLGSHVVQRKMLISGTNNVKKIDYLIDTWANLEVDKAKNILSRLEDLYGDAREEPVRPHFKQWSELDSGRTRIVQNFVMAKSSLSIKVQLTEQEDKFGNSFTLTASYLQAK